MNLGSHLKYAALRRLAWDRTNLKTHGMGFGHKHNLDEMVEARDSHVKQFVILGLIAAVIVYSLKSIWAATVPYDFFQFWHSSGTVSQWLWSARYVFAWGIGVTTLFSFISHDRPEISRQAEANYVSGIFTSVLAGVLEEIVFRWLYFFFYIFLAVVMNFLFFGFLGFGLVAWFTGIFGWLADVCTFGMLHAQLTNPATWSIAAGILCANGCFRDGHKYLGFFGYVNAWFIGMFFFWLMFTYGLVAAILVHFLYDFGIFTVRYIHQVIERSSNS